MSREILIMLSPSHYFDNKQTRTTVRVFIARKSYDPLQGID